MSEASNQNPEAPPAQATPPTVRELLSEGLSKPEAYGKASLAYALLAGLPEREAERFSALVQKAVEKATSPGPAVENEPKVPSLRVVACSPSGSFHRIGRRFTTQPTDIPLADLSEREIQALENTSSRFLTVMRVGG